MPFPYQAALLRQRGTLSHCLTKELIILSIFSTSERGTSYTVNNHISRGNKPNCRKHSLGFPGSPIFFNISNTLNGLLPQRYKLCIIARVCIIPPSQTFFWFLQNCGHYFIISNKPLIYYFPLNK